MFALIGFFFGGGGGDLHWSLRNIIKALAEEKVSGKVTMWVLHVLQKQQPTGCCGRVRAQRAPSGCAVDGDHSQEGCF